MKAAGRSVEDEVKFFCDGANALQGAAEESGEVGAQSGLVQTSAFEGCIVVARQDPGFIGNARGVGAKSEIVAAGFNDAQRLALFLLDDVAENAALFAGEVFAAGA